MQASTARARVHMSPMLAIGLVAVVVVSSALDMPPSSKSLLRAETAGSTPESVPHGAGGAMAVDGDGTMMVQLSATSAVQSSYVPGEDGTFAQNHQDTWAVNLARWNGWNASGFFLDLGAFNGLQCSNSALLEKSLGWKGICVEPFPQGFEDRRCVLVSRALSDVNDQHVHFGGQGQGRQMSSSLVSSLFGQVATTITIENILHCASGKKVGADCSGVGQLTIPRLINFASLDVEGGELSVLETFPWDSYQVGAWVVENAIGDGRDAQKQAGVRKLLLDRGYLAVPVANPGVDEYFVLPQFWDASLAAKENREHPVGSSGC